MARQRANLTDLLNENQKYDQLPSTAEQPQQEENTDTSIHQNSNDVSDQNFKTSTHQDSNTVLPQNDNEPTQQNTNTSQPKKRTTTSRSKSKNTTTYQKGKTSMPQNLNASKQQSRKTSIPQDTNEVSSQKERMTDKRDRVTFYLDPGQLEKLEEVKIQYRKKTGIRINEQEIVRRAIDRLDVDFLL
jgi:FtsZ-interacting cell division protein ZipA